MGIFSVTQGTQTEAQQQPRGVRRAGRSEGKLRLIHVDVR